MKDLLKKLLTFLIGSDNPAEVGVHVPTLRPRPHKQLTERQLIQMESEIGAELFGPIPTGHTRQFFNLDRTTWVWYERWTDETGKKNEIVTKYEIHQSGILKVQEDAHYTFITGEELDNFILAVQLYYERVMREIYKRDPRTGQKLNLTPVTAV